MRFATLRLGDAPAAPELTVIPLPIPADDESGYILSNVNRWRGQLQLLPISAAELEQQAKKVPVGGTVATLVDYRSDQKDGEGEWPVKPFR